MNITVIGCGRWGSCLAWYFTTIGYNVMMYGRESSATYQTLAQTHKNEYLTLPDNVSFTSDLKSALSFSDVIIVSISAQHTPGLFDEISNANIKKIFLVEQYKRF